jgi:adenylate cyclase
MLKRATPRLPPRENETVIGESEGSGGNVLVVDDDEASAHLLADILSMHGFTVTTAGDGASALAAIEHNAPDMLLLDIVMPGISGVEVCRRLRANPRFGALPIVLVTSSDPESEKIRGLEAGADDFLSKPVNPHELLARVRSLMRVKRLIDRTEAQAAELARLNSDLQQLVAAKVAEVERLSRLRRFLPPKLAERVVADAADDPLVSHRRDIAAVFFDLRRFTAFSERSAPEDVMKVLKELHEVIGTQTLRFSGTIERFVGDGVMLFFNDPEPVDEPCAVASTFALEVFRGCKDAFVRWKRNEFDIDLSCGIAYGYATVGAVGFADRIDYGAIGMVSNLAARLCAEARGGEILISARVAAALPSTFVTERAGEFNLKGVHAPVEVYRLVSVQAQPSPEMRAASS